MRKIIVVDELGQDGNDVLVSHKVLQSVECDWDGGARWIEQSREKTQ